MMMVIVPAVGAHTEELLQDTLKSMLVAFFTLAASFAFFWSVRCRNTSLQWHWLMVFPLALMAYALGGMVWSHTYLGGVEAIRWFLFTLLFFVGANTLTPNRVTLLVWGIHLGAVVASLWAALQFWMDFSYFAQGPNPASTFVNRNFFAEFIVCTLPFSTLLLSRVKDRITVFLLTFSLGFNIATLMMTGTRSALLGLLALILLLPTIIYRYKNQWASTGWTRGQVLALVALLLTTMAVLGYIPTGNRQIIQESGPGTALQRAVDRSTSIVEPKEYSEGSFSVRAQMWRATVRMIAAHPVAGVGAGAWEVQIPLYQEAGSQSETDYYAHNEVLQLIAEYGLVGWLFLFSLLAYLCRAAYRSWTEPCPLACKGESLIRSLTLSSLFVFLLVSNAGFPWRMASTGALFAMSLAVLAASDFRRTGGPNRWWQTISWKPHYSLAALSATAVCTGLALVISQQAVVCEAKLVRATKLALAISGSGAPLDARWDLQKSEILRLVQEGIAINPHYRKITPIAADTMASWGDWKNATWVWDSVLDSRPYIVVVLANAARGHILSGDLAKAEHYLQRGKALQPSAPALASVELLLWSKTGNEYQAVERAREMLATGTMDDNLFQAAYSLGMRLHEPQLAIKALELAINKWPRRAVDGWLKLGNIYDSVDAENGTKALQAYRSAFDATAPPYKAAILVQIPVKYHAMLRETVSSVH